MLGRLGLVLALTALSTGGTLAAGRPPAARPNTLTRAEKRTGWKLLFDGQTLTGWRGFKLDGVPDRWKAVDGSIRVEPAAERHGCGDLITRESYDRFELQLDWRIAEGGNSGVMYHVDESEQAAGNTGPELQLLDDDRHKQGKSPLTSAGACYGLYAPTREATRPAGQWNTARLVVDGNQVEHWLNGEKILSYDRSSDDWSARVAGSKFAKFPGFGKLGRGHIALQDFGDGVEFRNVKLRVIPPPSRRSVMAASRR